MRVTVDLAYDYKVHIIAPDEATYGPENEPMWQVLFEGTPDPGNMSVGFFSRLENDASDISSNWRNHAYNQISSSVVDKGWAKVDEALKKLYAEYEESQGIKTIKLGRYRLKVTRPDKNEPREDTSTTDRKPVWKLQIAGTGRKFAEEEGFTFFDWDFESLFHSMTDTLYHNVGSGVLDEKLPEIKEEMKQVYNKYHAENTSTDAPS